jgi:hypothetical protein
LSFSRSIIFLSAVSVSFLAVSPASATIDASLQMQLGNPSNATDTNNHDRYLIQCTVGSNYVVQASTNLAAGNWLSLQTNAAPFLSIESNVDLFGQRFYRGAVAP